MNEQIGFAWTGKERIGRGRAVLWWKELLVLSSSLNMIGLVGTLFFYSWCFYEMTNLTLDLGTLYIRISCLEILFTTINFALHNLFLIFLKNPHIKSHIYP